jgi:glutamate-5-semialdehyde dehydrogenase
VTDFVPSKGTILPARDPAANPQEDLLLLLLRQTRYVGRPGWVEFLLQASKVPILATHLGYTAS